MARSRSRRSPLLKKEGVEVKDTGEVSVDFSYKGDEAEPAENKGELQGLF
jgi:hypothetical protein